MDRALHREGELEITCVPLFINQTLQRFLETDLFGEEPLLLRQ